MSFTALQLSPGAPGGSKPLSSAPASPGGSPIPAACHGQVAGTCHPAPALPGAALGMSPPRCLSARLVVPPPSPSPPALGAAEGHSDPLRQRWARLGPPQTEMGTVVTCRLLQGSDIGHPSTGSGITQALCLPCATCATPPHLSVGQVGLSPGFCFAPRAVGQPGQHLFGGAGPTLAGEAADVEVVALHTHHLALAGVPTAVALDGRGAAPRGEGVLLVGNCWQRGGRAKGERGRVC